ncbi:MAG: HEAT repeat domain-containing protein [Pegethrix bostrychoides GSE-TBD4-15B]|jgi:HEAT repeat protein|uniref:HEAT repeat domain-containing protein n=1 Tax=Pegethrix bostrychoides GSE-TBD4-15B TaxID=2839662 RepID=A0A951P8T3_9CYAN|nr:HEAT repeat domain-containing protein [Pegethrix bostrychoides GSE-TBD4-15B]
MGDASAEFRAYLEAICGDRSFQARRQSYVPTDLLDRQRQTNRQPFEQPDFFAEFAAFDLDLNVQTAREEKAKPGGGEPEKAEKVERLPVLEGIRKYAAEHVLLVGRPGSGKSTALERLLLQEAELALENPQAPIPVLLKLRDGSTSVLDLLRLSLVNHDPSLATIDLAVMLAEGRFLLLWDGVNELPNDGALKELTELRQRYRQTPMIFTTRTLSMGSDLGIEKKLEMQPLSEPQMRQFTCTYLGNEKGNRLIGKLGQRLREFGETPLLLWMLCGVYAKAGKIPQNLGEVFRKFAEIYDDKKEFDQKVRSLQSRFLQALAFAMMPQGDPKGLRLSIRKLEAEDLFAKLLEKETDPLTRAIGYLNDLLRHHLLQPKNHSEIEFRHQLFQEYFAAEYLLRQLDKLDDLTLKKLYLNPLDWTESLSLMLGILDNEQQVLHVVQLALEVDLKLGARLAGEVKPRFQQATVEQVICLDVPEWLRVELLGRTRSNVAVVYLKQILVDLTSDSHSDVIRALAKMTCSPAMDILTSLLSHQDIMLRNEVIHALGQNGTEQAVNGLLQALADPVNFIRANSLKWLHKVDTELAIRALNQALNDSDYLVRETASLLLNRQTKQLSYTQDMIKGSEKVMPHKTVSQLFQDVESQDWFIRGNAVKALGEIELTDQMSATFLNNLIEATDFVRNAAAEALSKIANPQLLSQLWQFCRSDIREALDVISAIQERCRFYNYEIEQMALPAGSATDRAGSVINIYGGDFQDFVARDKSVKVKGDYIENQ